ncbi:MAG TPA: ADP-ribosylglycohydrolase family protein [Thermoleophilia bacterium]|nr:ADP-ribosylglycohydrolase family protein [Thermoleophilia bacterium]
MDQREHDPTISASARRRGCLLGLAVGDAFGAPVEFWRREQILERFPPDGIATLEPWHGRPAGTFTDDTQMSIATARGVLDWRAASGRPDAAREPDLDALTDAVWRRYLEWHRSRDWEGRAPGDTCMSSLAGGRPGAIDDASRNGSKGCGGVMRVAPLGLIGLGSRAFEAAARAAALTHGHVTSDLSSGFLALLVDRLVAGLGLFEATAAAREQLLVEPGCDETLAAVDAAVAFARSDEPPYAAIAGIGSHDVESPQGRGKGWVAEEALGIGLFSALRCGGDYASGVHAAATITGDSDSTASIAGAILGTRFGLEVVPAAWIAQVERRDELLALADELSSGD